MKNWKEVSPKYPTGKEGSFVASKREDNPIRMRFFISPEEAKSLYAKIFFKTASEGPPSYVHGGCQAAVLDEMMGSCGWQYNSKIVAAKIEVEFLKMLPSNQEVMAHAKVVKQEDRKVFIEASMYLGDTTYSKSSGLFMVLSEEKIKHLEAKLS